VEVHRARPMRNPSARRLTSLHPRCRSCRSYRY
jgi:hypothetical protein